ncbi:MAG: zinc ABC transporter substrate-binding protein [Verrucomicrobia bacterium]|nr:zinc ABC transporter substrate-binding protein [Verrucomicrobiota bacterium]MCH8526733.1 zinc ABC transporter substrate-binding protein [Kiritimatiellia bacterium]
MNFFKNPIFPFLTALLLLSGCRQPDASESGDRMTILVTVGMLTDIVRTVAGDTADVSGLIGEGVDPHLFSPSAADVRRIQSADAVLFVGHHLEGRLQPVFERQAAQGKRVAALAERIPEEKLLLDEDDNIDPHLWMDVSLWADVAREVHAVLADWLPDARETLDQNLAVLLADLETLDREVMEILGGIPEERRILITAHDAFGYLGRRYNLEVMGIQGMSTDSEAGLRHINALVAKIVERRIPAVFTESTVADRNVRALIEGAASRGHTVRMGGELYSDAMGAPGTPEGTYAGMIRHNARTLAEALGAQTP